ncbi:hypothetical protein D9619_003840 [Psilocybe cf. subviscida]|uniref:Uncharacterized protein n=1 Tax=Psilocybe cf. subviscida TaxID=2480587 RepID=A0A8H5AWJ0_9AGAR|nr:hypothetical protein D9619_003840 [Psilocybe cf. subviscida]
MSEITVPPSYNRRRPGLLETQESVVAANQGAPEESLSGITHQSQNLPHIVEPEDVVLTWNDGHEILGHSAAVEAHLTAQLRPTSHHHPEATSSVQNSGIQSHAELPPDYTQAQRPNKNVKYSFSPIGPNAMMLLPPPDAQDTRPQYYVAVSLNCFMPLSHITTVYRGANEYSPRVCEFEMGIISVANSRLQMATGAPVAIDSLLTKIQGPRQNARWNWKPQSVKISNLIWDCTLVPFTCKVRLVHQATPQLVAQFTSHIRPINAYYGKTPPSVSELEVLPAGQPFFDDILISLLIIERKRLTPKTKSESHLKALFNY